MGIKLGTKGKKSLTPLHLLRHSLMQSGCNESDMAEMLVRSINTTGSGEVCVTFPFIKVLLLTNPVLGGVHTNSPLNKT